MKLAPEACIVCGKKPPHPLNYLAGADPVGSMACPGKCTETAIERVQKYGRTDVVAHTVVEVERPK